MSLEVFGGRGLPEVLNNYKQDTTALQTGSIALIGFASKVPKMPRACRVVLHDCSYKEAAIAFRMPRACRVEDHVSRILAAKRETPRPKNVASQIRFTIIEASNVKYHAASAWHLYKMPQLKNLLDTTYPT